LWEWTRQRTEPGRRGIFVPLGNEVITGFADEFAVDDRAAEGIGHVEGVTNGRVGAVLNIEAAFEPDGGSPRAQAFHLDGATGPAIFDDLIAQFLDPVSERAFGNARGM